MNKEKFYLLIMGLFMLTLMSDFSIKIDDIHIKVPERLNTNTATVKKELGKRPILSELPEHETVTYTTVQDGNWTSASTWLGGNVPSNNISSGNIINVNHSVYYNINTSITNSGTIRIEPTISTTSEASLELSTNVNVENYANGNIYIINAKFFQCRFVGCGDSGTKQAGSFKNIGGYIYIENSYVEVAQDWAGEGGGTRVFKNGCLKTGQNFSLSNSGSKDTLIDVNISVGWHASGNFSVSDGSIYFSNSAIQLAGTSGNFEFNSGIVSGDIDLITLQNDVTGNVGGGIIKGSSSVNGSVALSAYCANTYQPAGVFSGSPGNSCSLTSSYFPAVCTTSTPIDPCDALASGNTDTDNDGIANLCDIDDDGDGILDSEEVVCSSPSSNSISSFIVSNEAQTASSKSIVSTSNAGVPFSSSTNYTINYGTNAGKKLEGVILTSGDSIKINPVAGSGTVSLRRNTSSSVPSNEIIWLGNDGSSTSSDALNIHVSSFNTMEEAMSKGYYNVGGDNLFNNDPNSQNRTNIERVDVVFPNGIAVKSPIDEFVTIAERGINNTINVAIITGVDANGVPTSYSSVHTITTGSLYNIGTLTYTISRKEPADSDFRPVLGQTQSVGVSVVDLSTFGISTGTTIYGYSVLPPDYNTSNIVDWNTYPTNTNDNIGGIDLVLFNYLYTSCISPDTDNDGLPDYLDIDADNDGIPDNVEGQTTAGYIPPSGVDADGDGLDDAYDNNTSSTDPILSGGIIPVNTDGTDNVDYLDLDSDNDGIPDIFENGDPQNTLSGNDIDNDGLDDNFDDNNVTWDVNDNIDDPNPTTLGDLDGDVAANGNNAVPLTNDVDYRDNSEICGDGLDNDGDGLIDCADSDCNPVISNASAITLSCPPGVNNGQIVITASGSGTLSYSITNVPSYQSSNTFSNLGPGQYTIRVKNDAGCESTYSSNPIVIDVPNCVEICNDGIDNDGDGLVDCDDTDCEGVGTGNTIDNQ